MGESAKHLDKPARTFHSILYELAESDSNNMGRPQHIRHSFQGFDTNEYEWDVRAAAEKDSEDDVVIARGSVEHVGNDSKRMSIQIAESIPFTKGAAKGADLLPLFTDQLNATVALPFEIETRVVDNSSLTKFSSGTALARRPPPQPLPAPTEAAARGPAAGGPAAEKGQERDPRQGVTGWRQEHSRYGSSARQAGQAQ